MRACAQSLAGAWGVARRLSRVFGVAEAALKHAASDGAGLWTVAIVPWLRADYPAGTAVEFDSPVCRMRLAADEAALSLRFNRFATPTVEFVEAF